MPVNAERRSKFHGVLHAPAPAKTHASAVVQLMDWEQRSARDYEVSAVASAGVLSVRTASIGGARMTMAWSLVRRLIARGKR